MAQLVKTVAGLAIASVKTFNGLAIASVKTVAGLDNTSGGGLASWSDNFTRANSDSLGTASGGGVWTEQAGDSDIVSNTAVVVTGGFAFCMNTQPIDLGSDSGYSRIVYSLASNLNFATFGFRFTAPGSPFYLLQVENSGDCYWMQRTSTGGSDNIIQMINAAGLSINNPIGITWTGTGSATRIRLWINATATSPVSLTEWDAAEGPDITFSTDPAGNAVDTGRLSGFGGSQGGASGIILNGMHSGGL